MRDNADGGGYLESRGNELRINEIQELQELFRAMHLGLEQRDYCLVPCRTDGPIGPELPPGDYRGSGERRHVFYARRWRLVGPGQRSTISYSSPEIFCTAYEASAIARALQVAHDEGRDEKSREIRAVLGVPETRR